MDNSMQLLIGLVLVGGAVGLVIYAVLSQVNEKSVVRGSLRQLEGYEVENVRDQELLAPITQRAVGAGASAGSPSLGRRFTPTGYADSVRTKFIQAGNGSADAVDRFLAIRVVTVALSSRRSSGSSFFWNLLGLSGLPQLIIVFLLLAGAALAGPDALLSRRVEERQLELRRKLPDILDLLTISVEAGLGFEQALDRTVAAVPGPLSDEFARMLGEVRAGASRADAMRSLEARANVPEIRSFVLAILQADTFGVSIGRILRAQADEMRVKRRQMAQERAQKAPVKMLIPMVFCVFPALFVVVIGPRGHQHPRLVLIRGDRHREVDGSGRAPSAPAPRLPVATGRLVRGGLGFALWGLHIGLDRLSDNSFLTHLATGRLILDHGVPRTDPYSFTANGQPWVVQSWLASVIYAWIESWFGANGIRVLMAALDRDPRAP